MKKQSGFTLIELMVVMAIIAILATAGLSAYTGYIKKARDTKRMADMQAMNVILASYTSVNGISPTTVADAVKEMKATNNKVLTDPLVGKESCGAQTPVQKCQYDYQQCDNGTGFVITTSLESTANVGYYTSHGITGIVNKYAVGSCKTLCANDTSNCTLSVLTEIKDEL